MKVFRKIVPVVAIGLGLAACQSVGPGTSPYQSGRPASVVDGNWIDPNGIISRFNGGVFETRTTDTNEKLAEGNYRYLNPQLVEIDMRSIVRGTASKVNCALVTQSQLNCTTSTGAQFTLRRA